MTGRAFRQPFQRSCQQRCRLLLESDAEKHAFGRFGIPCPDGKTATFAQMQAMVARVAVIIRSTNEVVTKNFPESPAYEYTAEELVWQLPARDLQGLLDAAYQCNLYRVFACHARPPATSPLGKATAIIRAWLVTEEARQLTSLVANEAQLTCIPSEIGMVTQLEFLSLVGNQLVSAPAELARLTSLQELNLGNNRLKTLPPNFERLAGLHVLYLDYNRLESLPAEFGRLAGLHVLYLGNNHLESLPAGFGQLTGLRELFLENNRLDSLPDGIWQLPGLNHLFLDPTLANRYRNKKAWRQGASTVLSRPCVF